MHRPPSPLPIAACIALACATAVAAPVCQVHAAATPPTVVELYTSEGCSSCPPADRWLSALKSRPDVLALAFHVNYWDRLGWVDRFASPEATARQVEVARREGGGPYTPEVVLDGRDWPNWGRLPAANKGASPVAVTLSRDGQLVTAQVSSAAGAPPRLDGYWAVLEDGFQSQVRAGENAGETLRHDRVVRLYRPVAAWPAADGGRAQIEVGSGVPEHPRQVVFVVTDAATHRPVQAASLGC